MSLLDLIFPKKCLGCGLNGKYLCDKCITKSEKAYLVCPECSKASFRGRTHKNCMKKYGLDGLVSVWKYKGALRKAILDLKFKFASDLSNELSDRLVAELNKLDLPKKAILIPIPLHKARQRWRGFNQSEVLGEAVAKGMGWGFNKDLLVRKVAAKPQTRLAKSKRKENIKGVFSLVPNRKLLTTNYLLFDDVYTTGSTIKEAAKILKKGGVKEVWGAYGCALAIFIEFLYVRIFI